MRPAGRTRRHRWFIALAVGVIFVGGMPTAIAAGDGSLCVAGDGGYVVNVNRLLDPKTSPVGGAVGAAVPPGTYNLTLVSADEHHPEPEGEEQEGEQWSAELYSGRDLVVVSAFTDDLPTEDAARAFDLPGTVDITSDITRLVPVLIDGGHSVTAVCAVFDVVDGPSPPNGQPQALDDAASTNEDTAVVVDVLANDSDPDGDVLTVGIVTMPDHGSVVVDAGTQLVTYTPDAGFVGSDDFTYEACDPELCSDPATVMVTVNGGPDALDDVAETDEDVAVAIDVLANDSYPDGDVLTVGIVTGPSSGSVVVDAGTGVVMYTPSQDFNGSDEFTYAACDPGGLCDEASVRLTVEPVNDAPTFMADDPPIAPEGVGLQVVDEWASASPGPENEANQAVTFIVTDVEDPALFLAPPMVSGAGTLSYIPTGVEGMSTFTVIAQDDGGVANGGIDTSDPQPFVIVIGNSPPNALDDAPSTSEDTEVVIGVLANDTDIDGDPLDVTIVSGPSDGTVTVDRATWNVAYTPSQDFNGDDTITYRACDPSGACDEAQVEVTVLPVNDAPSVIAVDPPPVLAGSGAVTVAEWAEISRGPDDEKQQAVTATVTDIANPGLFVVQPAVDPEGTLTFSPGNAAGTTTFTVVVQDDGGVANGGEDTSKPQAFTISVEPVDPPQNLPPTANSDTATTPVNAAVQIDVVRNDSDPDGDDIFVRSVIVQGEGTAEVLTSRLIRYTPVPGAIGRDSFTYELCDDGVPQMCDTAQVTVTTTDDPPVVIDVAIDVTISDPSVNVGELVVLDIVVSNLGPDAATGVLVELTSPPHLEVVTGDDSESTADLYWSVPRLEPQQSAQMQVVARAAFAAAGDFVAEVVTAEEPDTDSVPADGRGDDYATVTVDVQPESPTRPVVGFVFVDQNHNGRRDLGEGPPPNASAMSITAWYQPNIGKQVVSASFMFPFNYGRGGSLPMLGGRAVGVVAVPLPIQGSTDVCSPAGDTKSFDESGRFTVDCGDGWYTLKFNQEALRDSGLSLSPIEDSRGTLALAGGPVVVYALVQSQGIEGTVLVQQPDSDPVAEGDVIVIATSRSDGAEYQEITKPDGTYRLDLTPGTWDVTVSDERTTIEPSEGGWVVDLPAGETAPNVDFVLVGPSLSTVTGIAWLDSNRNGLIDEGEPGLDDVGVRLEPNGGSVIAAQQFDFTSAGGGYRFDDVPDGEYVVVIERIGPASDRKLVTPERATAIVAADSSASPPVNFGFTEPIGQRRPVYPPGFPWWVIIPLLLLIGVALLPLPFKSWPSRPPITPPPVPIGPPDPPPRLFPPPIPGDPGPPYPGPRPFLATERDRFFGREDEIRRLIALTYANRVTVLFGPSGAGKTSLLVAGYIPSLDRADFEVLPIVPFRGDEPRRVTPADGNRFVDAALGAWSEGEQPSPDATLASWLGARDRLFDDFDEPRARVLIFDQFEEIFAPYPERWQQRHDFFEQLEELLSGDRLDRIVISIEETQLGALEPLLDHLDLQSRTQFRLEPLAEPQALEALVRPLDARHVRFAPGLAERTVQDLRQVGVVQDQLDGSVAGEYVDPLRLQLVATAAWRNGAGAKVLTAQHLRTWFDSDKALTDFYDSAVRDAGGGDGEDEVRAWIEANLITLAGTRAHVLVAAAEARLSPQVLASLELAGLVTRNPSEHGDQLKLAHDRFVSPVLVSNDEYRDQRMAELSTLLLVRAAARWVEQGRDDACLLDGEELDEARALARDYPTLVGIAQREFLDASQAAAHVGS